MLGDVSGTMGFDQDPMPTNSISKERKRGRMQLYLHSSNCKTADIDNAHVAFSWKTREDVKVAFRTRWRGAR